MQRRGGTCLPALLEGVVKAPRPMVWVFGLLLPRLLLTGRHRRDKRSEAWQMQKSVMGRMIREKAKSQTLILDPALQCGRCSASCFFPASRTWFRSSVPRYTVLPFVHSPCLHHSDSAKPVHLALSVQGRHWHHIPELSHDPSLTRTTHNPGAWNKGQTLLERVRVGSSVG